jgi:regulator of replication initiation timing
MASLKKKYDKVKDWKYLADLYKQCDADKRAIQNLEKDNKALKTAQQKAEYRLARKLGPHGSSLFGDGITHTELVGLDNEMKVLRHKADYMQEKLYKEQQEEKEQERELDKLREKMKQAHVYEQKIIEKAKRMYKIDFEDAAK